LTLVNATFSPGQTQLAYDVRRLSDEINWDYAVIERLKISARQASILNGSVSGRFYRFGFGAAALKVKRD
jgi:hypothetical protein